MPIHLLEIRNTWLGATDIEVRSSVRQSSPYLKAHDAAIKRAAFFGHLMRLISIDTQYRNVAERNADVYISDFCAIETDWVVFAEVVYGVAHRYSGFAMYEIFAACVDKMLP